MRDRAFLWVLALSVAFLMLPAGPALGQLDEGGTLSPAERSVLDSRFERIVRKSEARTLETSIRELRTRRASARTEAAAPDRLAPEDAAAATRKPRSAPTLGPPRFSFLDVRPDARTSGGTPLYDAIVRTENPAALRGRGALVVGLFDGFATVRATPSQLRSLAALPGVNRIRTPRRAEAHNDVGVAEVGARALNNGAVGNTEYRGEGTIACIIDSGIDWSHPDFTDENGNTRIRAIWDQIDDSSSVSTPEQRNAARFGPDFTPDYGAEYLRNDVQTALDGGDSLITEDIDGHGTHVAGTAVSSGEAYEASGGTERYAGAAPNAELVVVKAGNDPFPFSNVLSGVQYCQALAAQDGKPVVINMSLGTDFAPHDGSSPEARTIENLVDGGNESGTVVVTSAGNSSSPTTPIHTQTDLPAGDSADVEISVTPYQANSGSQNDLFVNTLWAYEPGPYEITVFTPGEQNQVTLPVDDPQAAPDTAVTTPQGVIVLESATEGNGRYFLIAAVDAQESAPPAEGSWTVRIRHQGTTNTPIHGWFVESSLGSGGRASFQSADNEFTIGSPGTSRGAIAVGNYIHQTRWSDPDGRGAVESLEEGTISPSSSRGPTVDGRTKPAIAAPGTFTSSALSDDAPPTFGDVGVVGDGEHQMLTGTSMSAPLVAGSVALLLQEDPSLSTNRVRTLLKNTARVDDQVEAAGGAANQTFGNGKLNVERALARLRNEPSTTELLAYDEPASFDQSVPVALGGPDADRAALRFTPSLSGRAAGVFLTLASNRFDDSGTLDTEANRLTDSLYVSVWSDDGGTPGSRIGERVAVPGSALRPFAPNFVNLRPTGAMLQADTDYHVVVEPKDGGGEVDLLAETAAPTAGRSATFDGGSWSGTGNDLVARVQVTSDVPPPPAVAGLSLGTAAPRDVGLQWQSVQGTISGYRIFRSTSPFATLAEAQSVATVGPDTTSFTDTTATAGRTYYYRVGAVDAVQRTGDLSSQVQTFLYPQSVSASVSRRFGDGGQNRNDYRLVALPGAVDRDLGSVVPGEEGVDWTALWDDGSSTDFLVEYDGSDTFHFRPGRGFWLVSKNDLSFSESLSTVSLAGDTATTIPVHDGWNIIANPFEQEVSWSAVSAANDGSLQPIFGFDGTFSRRRALAPGTSGEAFYFFNDSGLSELTIPYPGAPQSTMSSTATATAKRAPQAALTVAATPTGADSSAGSSTVRIHPAEGRSAPADVVAPPQQFAAVSLRIRAPEASARRGLLMSTTRSFAQGQTIPLRLRTTADQPVRLRVGDGVPKEASIALVHPEAGTSYDLSAGQSVTIAPTSRTTPLRLAVGSEGYVDQQEEVMTPDAVRLTSAPNPARRRATLRFTLPEAGPVHLSVYDVLGRRVATLVDGRREAGRHRVPLSVDDLSSGVYVGRLTVGNRVITRKLTVVR